MKPTLAVDIATKSGFAVEADRLLESGSVLLWTAREAKDFRAAGLARRGPDLRFVRLCALVREKVSAYRIERVVFEDVAFCTSRDQGQLWASLRSALWCASPTLEFHCVGASSLKLFFAGSGKADKAGMAEALLSRPHYAQRFHKVKGMLVDSQQNNRVVGDDEVDALALLEYARDVDAGRQQWKYSV